MPPTVQALLVVTLLPGREKLEAFFAPFGESWGVQHGAMDSGALLLLVLLRWFAIVALCPFFGGRLVPGSVKVILAFLMAWFCLPSVSHQIEAPLRMTPLGWWAAALHEVTLGLLIGFGSSLVFFAATMAGQFLDTARGALTANMLVPQLQTQSTLLGDFFFQFFIVIYLLAGGHIFFIGAVLDTFQLFPPTGGLPGAALVHQSFLTMSVSMFGIMIKIVAPALLVVLLTDLILGVANRMAPQLDVFFMGLGLKPALALTVVALSLGTLAGTAPEVLRAFHQWLGSWLLNG
jgi:type III secretory pathway component EscT